MLYTFEAKVSVKVWTESYRSFTWKMAGLHTLRIIYLKYEEMLVKHTLKYIYILFTFIGFMGMPALAATNLGCQDINQTNPI